MRNITIEPIVTPGAFIGYRKDGRPIHLLAGGSGDGDGTDGGSDPAGSPGAGGSTTSSSDGDGDGTGGRGGTTAGHDPAAGTGAAGDGDNSAKVIAAIREDFKAERAKRQAAEKQVADLQAAHKKLEDALAADKADREKQMDALAKALGLKQDDQPPTPEQLAAQLAEAQRNAEAVQAKAAAAEERAAALLREQQIERAVLRAAPGLEANGIALLDSRSFTDTLAKLDPAADDFADRLSEAIKAAVAANPAYKAAKAKPAAPPAPSSGGEFNGSPGGNRQWTDEDVERASPSELQAAMRAGLLANLGAGIPGQRRSRR